MSRWLRLLETNKPLYTFEKREIMSFLGTVSYEFGRQASFMEAGFLTEQEGTSCTALCSIYDVHIV